MRETALGAHWAIALFCLGLSAASPAARAQSAGTGPGEAPFSGQDEEAATALVQISDTALIGRAWRMVFPDSAAPPGEYVALIPPGPRLSDGTSTPAAVYLLRNGTGVGKLDFADWEILADESSLGRRKWIAALEGPERREIPLLWEAGGWDAASLLARAEWPAGFAFSIGSVFSSVRTSKPQYRRHIDFAWDQKLFSHFLLGASLHRSQFGGGLTRLGEEVADTAGGRRPSGSRPDFWGEAHWWWSVSAGVPGLRYTLALANQPLPEFFWLETRAAPAIRSHSEGKLVNQWTGERMERAGNLSHALDARFGALRYGILFDSDAYRVPVQTFGCDELPAWFFTWGAGLVVASDLLATRAWLDIPDAALRIDAPRNWPTRFRVAFLRLEMDYRSQRSFSLGVSVRVRIDNPIMNLPALGS